MVMALSSAGLGFIFFRIVGYKEDRARKIERKGLLVVSFILFAIAVVFGFVTATAITGFWSEVISMEKNARDHLLSDTMYSLVQILSFAQIGSATVGVLFVSSHVFYKTGEYSDQRGCEK